MKEVGYDGLSMAAIAAQAGVSKATIYRRWANKAAVVASAVEHQATGTPPEPRGGELRDDLLEVLQWLAQQIAEQDMAMLAAVLAGMRSDPDLAAAMRGRLHRDEAAMLERSLRRAAKRGEALHPHADSLFAEIASAVIVHRLLIVGEAATRPFSSTSSTTCSCRCCDADETRRAEFCRNPRPPFAPTVVASASSRRSSCQVMPAKSRRAYA